MRPRHALGPVGLLLFAVTFGCAPLETDLVRQGDPGLRLRQSKYVRFSGVRVRRIQAGIEVSGTLCAGLGGPRPVALVHVDVLDARGLTIARAEGRLRGQSHSARQRYRSRFRVEVPVKPPEDARVIVSYGSIRALSAPEPPFQAQRPRQSPERPGTRLARDLLKSAS